MYDVPKCLMNLQSRVQIVAGAGPFCAESKCSLCACMEFLWVIPVSASYLGFG